MLCWNINKVNSKCRGWNSPHHIWDQEMPRVAAQEELALIVATGLWIWRSATSFKSCNVMEVDCDVCLSPVRYQKPRGCHNGNKFKNHFLAELAVIAKKNAWWLNRTGSVGSAAYGFCSSQIQCRWGLSLPRVSGIYFTALLPHIKPDSSA